MHATPSNPVESADAAGDAPGRGPNRTFLGWDGPALPLVASHLATTLAGGGALDLRDHYLVLPGARAGRRLVELLLDEAKARDLRLIPPRVVTPGALPEHLYRTPLPLASPLAGTLAWSRALREAPGGSLSRIFPHRPRASDTAGWDALGGMIQRLDTEVAGAGLDFSRVAGITWSAAGFDDGPRWSALARLQESQRGLLAEAGLADPGDARLEAIRSGSLRLPGEIWLVGVVDLLPVTAMMLKHLSQDRIHPLVHAPAEEATGFTPYGLPDPVAWATRIIDLDHVPVVMGEGPGDQAEGVARLLASWEGRYDSDSVVIGVPGPELEPFVERRLSQGGLRTRFAEGRPLASSPPVALLEAIRGWLTDSDFRTLADLLRHPDLDARGPGLADRFFNDFLPHRMWTAAPDLGPERDFESEPGFEPRRDSGPGNALEPEPEFGPGPDFELWPEEQVPSATTLPELLEVLERLLQPLRGEPRPLSAWRDPVLAVLIEVYGGQELDRGNRSHRQILGALDEIRRATDTLTALPGALDRTSSAGDFLRLVLEELEAKTLPPDPDPGSVELVGWLELHLDDSRAMIVTGMNEGVVPASVVGDLFLPDSLRVRLGLMNNHTRLGRDAYLLASHIASRDTLGLTLGRMDSTADPLRPSRLLLTGDGASAARRLLRFLRSTLPVDLTGAGQMDPAGGSISAPPHPTLTFPTRDRFSVTDFRSILADPYLFVLQRLYGLSEEHDEARELDPAGFGLLAHKVLETFGRLEMADPSLTGQAAGARMRDCLKEIAGARFGSNTLPAVKIQLRHLEARLLAVARWHAQAMADGWRVAAVEAKTLDSRGSEADVPMDTPFGTVTLRGRIDRVDVHPATGRWRLIDYKSSEGGEDPVKTHLAGKREEGNWIDFQLPLYRLLLPHLQLAVDTPLPPDPFRSELVEVGYVVLPRDLEGAGWRPAGFTAEEVEAAVGRAGELVGELARGEVSFDRARADRVLYPDDPLRPLLGLAGLPPDSGGDPGEETADENGERQ